MRRDIMSRIATLALAAVAAGFGAVSCAEEEIEVEAPMQKVTFAAASVYDNLPSTRTIYSGDEIEINGQKTERIDWVNGDRIYVRGLTCDQYIHPESGGELTVASHVSENGSKHSVATLEGDANIHWAPNETNVFVAAYPSSTLYWEDDSQISPRFTGFIPATQAQSASHTAGGQTVTNPSMDYAAMVAKESVTERPTDPVTLHFSPAFTAFEFNMAFAGASGSNTISKFEMESTTTDLVGTWEWNYNSGVNSFTCDGSNKKITVNFDNQVIDADHPLRFTVFALPQQITNVTLKFYLSSGTKTLSLKDKTTGVWEVFEPCKKYRISTPGAPSDWEYVIECTDPSASLYTGEIPSDYTHGTVTSYKQKHDGSNKTAVEWEVEGYYEDAECATPYNGDKTQKPYWMPGYDGSDGDDETGPGSTTGEDVDITYAHSQGDTTETITPEAQALNALIANHAQMGSQASPYNLSNPGNNGAAGYIAESANSYIVNGCGWYTIPLVMGNGIKNNDLNPDETTYKGYDGDGTNDLRVLFKNYKGNNITNPWLNQQGGTPTSAEIVWEDIEGLIETQKEGGANTYDLPAGCISSDGKWLYFHVPTVREGKYIYKDAAGNVRNEPRQGNAVIAVKDAAGDIMWSYHVWVTDYVPRNYPGYDNSSNKDVAVSSYWEADPQYQVPVVLHQDNVWNYSLMNRILGHIVYGTKVNRDYQKDSVYVKLRQNDGTSTLTTVMKVVQLEGHPANELKRSQPFYAQMRKDAYWPGTGLHGTLTLEDEPVWYGKYPSLKKADGTTRTTRSQMTIAQTITEPAVLYLKNPGTYTMWYSDYPVNLWNAKAKAPSTTDWCYFEEITTGGNWRIVCFNQQQRYLLGEKTIYDPCPAGYVIPQELFISAFMQQQFEFAADGNTQWAGKQAGIWGFNGLDNFDGDTFTFYTDRNHSSTYTLPATGVRDNQSDGRFILDELPLTLYLNLIADKNYSGNPAGHHIGGIMLRYKSNDLKMTFYLHNGGATAILPINDSVGPDPADYPTKEQYQASQGGSGAPSASSSLGRYTVMRLDSGSLF